MRRTSDPHGFDSGRALHAVLVPVMQTSPYLLGDLLLVPSKEGLRHYTKVSYPVRYGHYSEIRTGDRLFQFNLNGEIKTIRGLRDPWPEPSEWLKRTAANDWVYYATGGYAGVYDALGEYYLPCFDYPSNRISTRDPFKDDAVLSAIAAWEGLVDTLKEIPRNRIPKCLWPTIARISGSDPESLQRKAGELRRILGSPVSVLPPDTRHVDYDVIPIIIADGCAYNCNFCSVKSGREFTPRASSGITRQIESLKNLFGCDLTNYNAIFLGQHDALRADREIIEATAMAAYEAFEIERSHMRSANLFMFGSVDAFLQSEPALFDTLNKLPFRTYINIGLESADDDTLRLIGKAVDAKSVEQAFRKMLETNEQYENIEITVNFLFDERFPESHLKAFLSLSEACTRRRYGKGAVYFSPLYSVSAGRGAAREQRPFLNAFFALKNKSRLATYVYLIQRL